jgi:hypothetical protein|tara:strand:- start:71 stop:256 length:186 start_codon:yes stop_codon:yes gene_type:complete
MGKTLKKKAYKATKLFKGTVSDRMLSKDQYKAMLGGKSDELKGVTEKRMNYLLVNNLIEEV